MILKVTITRIHRESEDHCCNLLHKMISLEVPTVGAKLNKRGCLVGGDMGKLHHILLRIESAG